MFTCRVFLSKKALERRMMYVVARFNYSLHNYSLSFVNVENILWCDQGLGTFSERLNKKWFVVYNGPVKVDWPMSEKQLRRCMLLLDV